MCAARLVASAARGWESRAVARVDPGPSILTRRPWPATARGSFPVAPRMLACSPWPVAPAPLSAEPWPAAVCGPCAPRRSVVRRRPWPVACRTKACTPQPVASDGPAEPWPTAGRASWPAVPWPAAARSPRLLARQSGLGPRGPWTWAGRERGWLPPGGDSTAGRRVRRANASRSGCGWGCDRVPGGRLAGLAGAPGAGRQAMRHRSRSGPTLQRRAAPRPPPQALPTQLRSIIRPAPGVGARTRLTSFSPSSSSFLPCPHDGGSD